jgi:hypothetical protein
VFVKHRYAADTTTLKCNAGEMIGIYAMLRHFVEVRIPSDGDFAAHRDAFLAACSALDIVLLAKRDVLSPSLAAAELRRAVKS